MSTEAVEQRSISLADIEVREDAEGGGRTIVGVAVPYDTPTEIVTRTGSYTEIFRRGVFAKTFQEAASRVKLMAPHNDDLLPIGHATHLEERGEGAYMEFAVAPTARGEEALTLVKHGTLDGMSIEFVPVRSTKSKDGKTIERSEAKLIGVALVSRPAYDSARVLAVRDEAVEDVEPGETTQPVPATMSVRELRLIAEQVRSTAPAVTPAEVRSHLT
jgi:HK97 family phage prohead protease